MRARVLTDLAALRPVLAEWDALAVAASQPFASPAWGCAWWRHLSPPSARLSVVVVESDTAVVGVAPFFSVPGPLRTSQLRLLGAGVAYGVQPVAAPGSEAEVAAAVVTALRRAGAPDVLSFEAVAADSDWPAVLRGGWEGPPADEVRRRTMGAPYVELPPGGFEPWLGARSANFRQQVRRRARRLAAAGVEPAVATGSDVPPALQQFARLHRERWTARGGSAVLRPAVEDMLRDVAAALPSDRLRVVLLTGEEVVAAHVILSAGTTSAYWLGGFDARWAQQSPALVALVAAVQDVAERGGRVLDLGPGEQDYKYRLADGERILAWSDLVPQGPAHLRVRAGLVPALLYRRAVDRLPDDVRQRLLAGRTLLRRARRRVAGISG